MTTAAIEGLPVELLQPIFASSGYNLALIQASNILGAQLSSDHVYNRTCDYYLTGRCEDYAVSSAAQTAIFASKWMTWSFFKSWIVRTYARSGCLCGLTPDEGCFDAQWPPDFENATSMVFSRSHLPRLAFVRCRLPANLLCGPWTEDKVQFLRFLLWTTSMTVDWRDPEMSQIPINGRRQAFLENNLDAVELFNHNRRLGRPPTLETVHFAVAEAGCNRSIVYDTLRAAYRWSSRGDTWDYTLLDQWCGERVSANDVNGLWLRDILQALRHFEIGICDKGMDNDILFGKLVDEVAAAHSDEHSNQLLRRELPWNKVIAMRGWLIVGSLLPTHHRVAHQIHWTQVMQQSGPRMYSGPSCPRRLSCCSGDGRDIQQGLAWLNERRQTGWFYWSRHDVQKRGVHRVVREDLGDFWKHRGGQYRTVTGLCRNGRGSFAVRLEMWIPCAKIGGAWNGMLDG